ncbi:MAG: tetratricopeptide repeat protein [Candidatus Korobacteraceae bacterium]
MALYSPAGWHRFLIFDDHDYVTANPHIHQGLSWSTIRWAFTSTELANWHPLTWLSHALDYQLFALSPTGHHFDSVLIHAFNVLLLFLVLSWVTKRTGPSLLVAALFAVHPLNVESVAWVAERKNVLSTFFFLSAIGSYVWYAQKPDWRRYVVLAALFAMGLMAKPMVITLPCVLLLLDYWPLGRIQGDPSAVMRVPQFEVSRLVLEKVPLLVLSAVSAAITVKAQRAGMAVRSLRQFSFAVRVENAVVAYGMYLWKMLWPARLAPLYPHPGDTLPAWQVAWSAIVLLTVTAFVIRLRRRRYLLVGWLWFLGTLIPVIGLVQVGDAALADRYAYVPLIGIFVMIAFGLADLAEVKKVSLAWQVVPALCVLAGLGLVTHRQLSYWNSEYDLWSHTLAVTRQNPFAHDALGAALLEPDVAMTSDDLTNLDTDQKRMDAARQHYEDALSIRRELAQHNPNVYLPDMATTLNNLGNLDRIQQRMEAARQHYEESLDIHWQLLRQNADPYLPDMAMALNNLGFLDKVQKRAEEAHQRFGQALEIYRKLAMQNPDTYLPDMAMTLNNLAITEREQKRGEEARSHYEEALKIRRQLAQRNPDTYLPDLAMTLNDLANLDVEQRRTADAGAHYEEALKIYRQLVQQNPDVYQPFVAGTLNNLGFLDKSQNRIEESRTHYLEAMTIYQELSKVDPDRYAGDVARVEASLKGLPQAAPSK